MRLTIMRIMRIKMRVGSRTSEQKDRVNEITLPTNKNKNKDKNE